VSIPGVYGGFVDKVPMGAAINKGLTFKMGQTHVHRYMKPLLERIQNGEIDPSRLITHRLGLDDAPWGYKTFRDKEDDCIKIVLKPDGNGHFHAHGGNGHGHSHGPNGGNGQEHDA
jgi:threonine dehydrogenase-like Zn-dependent dehydrogenase